MAASRPSPAAGECLGGLLSVGAGQQPLANVRPGHILVTTHLNATTVKQRTSAHASHPTNPRISSCMCYSPLCFHCPSSKNGAQQAKSTSMMLDK